MYQKLDLIPEFGAINTITVLLELGDYTRFKSAEAIAKFCGAIPKSDESGQMKAKGHINQHSNKYLRVVLYNAAGVFIIWCQRDSDLGWFTYRQSHIRNLAFKKASMKGAQKISRILYQILVRGINYDSNFELQTKKQKEQEQKLNGQINLLYSKRLHPLKRNIQELLVNNYENTIVPVDVI